MKYYVPEHMEPTDAYSLEYHWVGELNLRAVALKAAEDWFDGSGGDALFPQTFVILDDEYNELRRFEIDLEVVPHFFICGGKEK